jgi:hypothetical protein
MTKVKATRKTAIVLTFLFSAILHEYVFWVAFQVIRPWFFLGMFVQGSLAVNDEIFVTFTMV